MGFELGGFADEQLDVDYLTYLIDRQMVQSASLQRRLWDYFRNPMVPVPVGLRDTGGRLYMQAQEEGLPARITGRERVGGEQGNLGRKEVVIENDIAWRIHTMIDFLFGQAPNIRSTAANPELAGAVERLIATMFDANGGVSFFQELALLGAVYGFVDVAFRIPAISPATGLPTARSVAGTPPAEFASASAPAPGTSAAEGATRENVPRDPMGDRFKRYLERAAPSARSIILETVEAPRVLPILDENNFRQVRYWVQRLYKYPSRMENGPWTWRSFLGGGREQSPAVVEVVEIISPRWWQRYEDRVLTAEGENGLGQLPVVHIQNMPLPLSYEGLGDVEPLIPLQDELNTRLSDRASHCLRPIDFTSDVPSWNKYRPNANLAWGAPGGSGSGDSTSLGTMNLTQGAPAQLNGSAVAAALQAMVDGAEQNLLLRRTDSGPQTVNISGRLVVEFDLISPPN